VESGFECGLLTPKDARQLAEVYKTVFETYPFPIHSSDYLARTMGENIVYFGVREGERLVAVSSCEMDAASKNVEMTDFATLPGYRAKKLASYLLLEMENEMR
jgi:putative beta-lysine N-acetyltransferase